MMMDPEAIADEVVEPTEAQAAEAPAEPEQPETTEKTPAIPEALPVLPLRGGTVIFPLAVVPLVPQRPDAPEQPGPADLYEVGTAGVIHQLMRSPDGTIRLVLQGLERIRVGPYSQTEPYLKATVVVSPDALDAGVEAQGLR